MRKINKNVYPSGGHVFKESDGARIYGDDWPGVIARVKAYRERAGLPAGNPAEEVINQACANMPSLCYEVTGTEAKARAVASLKGRVLRWFRDIIPQVERLIFVQTDEWKRRAAICATCPENQPLPGGCATCRAAVAELRKKVLEKRPIDGRLNACSILGEDLPAAVHFEQPAESRPELPGNCWRKKTI